MYKQRALNRRNQNLSRRLLDRRGHRRNHRNQVPLRGDQNR
jgi:hypothetical protein